ncbi:SGNH hydrolase domain-containing protein [Nocardioides sp.]|uniref:SGNH hydrolase domain-containing protein n=1 Tax=Nocardioides sp. TaxID=35761 RepID=UPI0027204CAF|nr:SGNH hydrolase domain-containing protein [Nocardioides sp.]MDO9456893.1 SGNH hydrolase domain-containing protein [Nocardioides sp.]
MKMRPLVSLLVTTVVAALLATLLATTATAHAATADRVSPPATSAKPKPSQDFPHMPRRCATPKEKIPSKPVVCGLTRYDDQRPTVVLWGDSHSWMFIPALKEAVSGRGVNLVAVMMGSCPPMDNRVGATDAVPACFRSNALGIEVARKLEANGQPYRIVLAGSWQRYVHARKVGDRTSYVGQMAIASKQGTPRLARTLRSIGAEVDVVGQVATVPERHRSCPQGNEPFACQLARGKSLPEAASTKRWVTDALGALLGRRPMIDVNPAFCTAKVCKGKIGTTRTWFDDLHLSATRSKSLASYFAATVDAVDPDEEPGGPGCTIPILCG